jgi:catechol 2,3-dioxygenase-like lactoylglutathione lyase family enzyme
MRCDRITQSHAAYAPGLHHFCFRVESEQQVKEAATALKDHGIAVSEATPYPEYAPNYVACFLSDPDGIRLEITNYRHERRQRHDAWETLESWYAIGGALR